MNVKQNYYASRTCAIIGLGLLQGRAAPFSDISPEAKQWKKQNRGAQQASTYSSCSLTYPRSFCLIIGDLTETTLHMNSKLTASAATDKMIVWGLISCGGARGTACMNQRGKLSGGSLECWGFCFNGYLSMSHCQHDGLKAFHNRGKYAKEY